MIYLFVHPLSSNTKTQWIILAFGTDSLHDLIHQQVSDATIQVMGEMAAGAANAILNPLAVIKGNLQLLQHHLTTRLYSYQSFNKTEDYFEFIYEHVDMIDSLIKRFLSISKPLENKVKHSPLSVVTFLHEFLPSVQKEALQHQVALRCEFPYTDGHLLLKQMYLEEMLSELLSNAFDASYERSEVVLAVAVDERYISFSVSDQGDGIPAELLPKLGSPFLTTKENALGLGLCYCFSMSRKLGGNVQVCSRPKGTKVTLKLPIIHL